MGNESSSEEESGGVLALSNWRLVRIAWCTTPLKKSFASKLGGKHSFIDMAFASLITNEEIGFSVERDESGIHFGRWLSQQDLMYMGAKIRESTSAYVRYRTLSDVSKICTQQNQQQYDISNANCHKFAKYLWDYCTNTPYGYNDKEPNTKLAKIAKAVKTSGNVKKKASRVVRYSMKDLDPYFNSDFEILEIIIGLSSASI